MNRDVNFKSKKALLFAILKLLKGYFIDSERRLMAWLMLSVVVACVLGSVFLLLQLSVWSAAFWAALAAKDSVLLLARIKEFAVLVGAIVGMKTTKKFLLGQLVLSWRDWLTLNLMHQLIDKQNYLILQRTKLLADMHQRLQEDIKNFIKSTPSMAISLLESSLLLVGFAHTLWVVGGAASFTVLGLTIIIPGYLLWLALIVALSVTVMAYWIAKPLHEKNHIEKTQEGEFRQLLHTLLNNGESIALEHAENYYKVLLSKKVQQIREIAEQKNYIQGRLGVFQELYTQVTNYLPPLLGVPLYFSGSMELGELMQVAFAFSQINSSFNVFIQMYEDIALYNTSIQRSAELQQAIDALRVELPSQKIERREKRHKEDIKVSRLTLGLPGGNVNPIFSGLNLRLKPEEHIVIRGSSGLGKSTFFKALSASWEYGQGKITVPQHKKIIFLAQKPILSKETIKANLAFTDPIDTYEDVEYLEVLRRVGLHHRFESLYQVDDWDVRLSEGEKQLIAVARALLKKPDWIFLDEATSAMDIHSEARAYGELKKLNATLISIAHRQTVDAHHHKILFFSLNEKKEIAVREQRLSFN